MKITKPIQHYAYLRVSTQQQTIENQKSVLINYFQKKKINLSDVQFVEEILSGTKKIKPKLDKLVEQLEPGDILYCTEMSRLGRTTRELIHLIHNLLDKKIHFVFLKENLKTLDGNHSTLMLNLFVTIFSAFVQVERDLISQRTTESLERLKAEGKHIGRPSGSKNYQSKLNKIESDLRKYREKGLNFTACSKLMSIKISDKTIAKYCKQLNI
jgi:DNA invertase Pin-like site-specific DNA recombinase